jgi:hypothetical protein
VTPAQFGIAYAVVGVISGVLAARYAYREGDHQLSAGCAGAFVALFWPFVAVTVAFGWVAQIGTKENGR